jgi:hypothetical protein
MLWYVRAYIYMYYNASLASEGDLRFMTQVLPILTGDVEVHVETHG